MRKIYMALLATILISASSYGQKGNNRIGVGADLGIPTGDFGSYFKTGIGFYAKGLFGVGKSGQVTLTTGYSSFKNAGDVADFSASVGTVPLLIGYRAIFNGFFIEPQMGYSILNFKATSDEAGFFTQSTGAFTWAAGAGYVFNKQFEVSARYQGTSKNGSSLNFFGLRLGYNFSLGGSK